MQEFTLPPDIGLDIAVHNAALDGFAAGVQAAIEAAKDLRLKQVIDHMKQQLAPAPPAADPAQPNPAPVAGAQPTEGVENGQ